MFNVTEMGIKLESAEVVPFRFNPRCPACGSGQINLRRVWFTILYGHQLLHVRPAFCAGSKAPTDEYTVQQQSMSVFGEVGPSQSRQFDVRNPCAGIERPHMHMTCCLCNHLWFTELRGHSKPSQGEGELMTLVITAAAFLLCLSGAFWFGISGQQREDEDLIRTAFNFGVRHSITEMTGEVNDQMTALKEALMQYMVRDAERRYKSQEPAEQ